MNKRSLQVQQIQRQKLQEVGLKLSQCRELRELSLGEAAIRTHIPKRLLEAIELGDLVKLPEPVYIQSFIRQYGNALGLNGVQLASEFPTDPVIEPQRSFKFRLPGLQFQPVHLYGVYMLLIGGAVYSLSQVTAKSVSQSPVSAEALQGFKASLPNPLNPPGPQLNSGLGPNTVASAPKQALSSDKSVTVGLKMTGESWVRVVVDGKEAFEGVMNSGQQQTWAGKSRVTVIAGNAGGVVAEYKGQAKALGEPGSVQEVSFPPDERYALAGQ
jgi:cytoskeletal protein RodZ